jgi:hypothetical protein
VPVYFQPNQELVVSDHILAGLSGSAALKVPVPTFNRTKGLGFFFFRSYFGRPFSGSAALKYRSYFQPNQGAGGCFRSYFSRPFRSAALKVPVLL